MKDKTYFQNWLGEILEEARNLSSNEDGYYDFAKVTGWRSSAEHFLLQLVGVESPYYQRFIVKAAEDKNGYARFVESDFEVMKSLLRDLDRDRVPSFRTMVEAEVFSDFIGMAEHMLDFEYYGAAAALMGGVLERGLRDIAAANGVSLGAPGDLAALNARIAKAGIYNALRQKEVQYFIDIRNKAAHGEFDKFTAVDARKLADGVRSLLAELTSRIDYAK